MAARACDKRLEPLLKDLGYLSSQGDNNRRPLILFLGAGVNHNFGPTWDELLAALVDAVVKRDKGRQLPGGMGWFVASKDISVYEKASLTKYLLGDHYLTVLRNILYKSGIEVKLRKAVSNESGVPETQSMLRYVGDLCRIPLVQGVVTYNYDNLLETLLYLMAGGHSTGRLGYSVFGEPAQVPEKIGQDWFPLYHVHGFLPIERRLPEPDSTRLVLAEPDYFESAVDSFSWQTTTQVHLLRNYTCLWIGVSLKDMNMRRLSHYAKRHGVAYRSYAVMSGEDLALDGNKNVAATQRRVYRTLLQTVGIDLMYSGPTFDDNATLVRDLVKHLKDEDTQQPQPAAGSR